MNMMSINLMSRRLDRGRRWGTGIVFAACTLVLAGCGNKHVEITRSVEVAAAPGDFDSIMLFCVNCHAPPNPASFAKDRWREEVEQAIRIYKTTGRTDLTIPDVEAAVAYFSETAPDKLVILPPDRVDDERFVSQELRWTGARPLEMVSSILCVNTDGERPTLLLTDMWTGELSRVTATDEGIDVESLGNVAHPAHIEPVDLDQDGVLDYLVADLGTLNPQAEKQGSVWLMRGTSAGGTPPATSYNRQSLNLGLSRVADARPIDYDNDGDLDLLVGDFGLHIVGSIYLGTNEGNDSSSVTPTARYTWKVIDPRPGTIALPTLDFDGDGRMDFMALVTQQYETVELKLNRGDGEFETKTIFTANDPSVGSSSIEVVDFDGDGDMDLIYTNGDTFDDSLAKPYHGIKWLENEGKFPFTVHEIATMPGCYHASSGDIDGDGDLDVAAVAYLPLEEVSNYAVDTFDGVAWFEQLADGDFKRHSIVKNRCQAATCALVDWDLDGDLDLIVPPSQTNLDVHGKLTVYLNNLYVAPRGDR